MAVMVVLQHVDDGAGVADVLFMPVMLMVIQGRVSRTGQEGGRPGQRLVNIHLSNMQTS